MFSGDNGGGVGEGLGALHRRLHVHFAELRDLRAGDGAPVFALEHGLAPAEIAVLSHKIAFAVSDGTLRSEAWLPLVVYATEVGYDFSGDEYWQTFEARTPRWREKGDRFYIREKFREFRQLFGGVEPAGPWATNFSIICWPITHAVLPADLQRHLARLLFDYRRALTSDLLSDPDELGRHLAARSLHTSSRFRYFAQNVGLLGRVAASLLLREEESSPFLLGVTLERIVEDLSRERLARQWLNGARNTAARMRTRGFLATSFPGGGSTTEAPRLAPAADPSLTLQRDTEGWTAFLEFPDLSLLAARFPGVVEELGHRRAVLAGVAGAPVARGRLLFPGQRFRLAEWPAPERQLLEVEGGEATTNSVMADQSVLSGGPWLFRVRAPGYATEVRLRRVRPGGEYVLLSEGALTSELPDWFFGAAAGTDGVFAYELHVPPLVDRDDEAFLEQIGVAARSELSVRPVGLFPGSWDGQGRAEWLAGDDPVLAVSSTRMVGKSIWIVDGEPEVIEWPPGDTEMFVGIEDLAIGSHRVLVSLFGRGDELLAEGGLEIRVRPPHARPETGTGREGLMLLPTPVNPTLTELWDGEASVEIVGPPGFEAEIELLLQGGSVAPLASVKTGVRLPVDTEDWAGLFERLLRDDRIVQKVYDESEGCEIRVTHVDLGAVSLRCERPFSALRWVAARDGGGPFLRLINNTEGLPVDVDLFEFVTPDRHRKLEVDDRSRLRARPGGLAVASAGSASASMILPPTVRHLEDLQSEPQLSPGVRSEAGVREAIELAGRWGAASRPADPFGERARIKVLRLITSDLAGLIGGHRWAVLERRAVEKEDVGEQLLLSAIGSKPYQRALAHDISRWTDHLASASLEERAETFATSLAAHALIIRAGSEDPRFAEFVLRLASAPDSVRGWDPRELSVQIGRALRAPFIIRAARCLVLAVESRTADDVPATFGGWAWR